MFSKALSVLQGEDKWNIEVKEEQKSLFPLGKSHYDCV